LFSRHLTAFSCINIAIFQKKHTFFRGKPPFIFNPGRFITDCTDTLQSSITSVLDPGKLAILARQSGFLQRESKLKPEEFIDTLIFSELDHSQLSLQECCNDLAQQRQKSLSKVALHNRFNARSLGFLKQVLAGQMASKLDICQGDNWKPFSRVIVGDSCKFSMPAQYAEDYPGFGSFGNKSAIMNLQYFYDLKYGNWESLEFTKATENDQSHTKKTLDRIGKGELHIRDLGFITMEYQARVIREQAFFLNRLHPQWKPVEYSTAKPIDWKALYRKMECGTIGHFETMVTIGKDKHVFNCRMIAVAVPEQIWAERIREAEKKHKSMGKSISDEYRIRCRFNVFITNSDEKDIKAADIIQLYRLRWQIELIFKNWKSLLDIHKVKRVKKERLECQLIAKFIWILLNWKIFWHINVHIQRNLPGYACSTWKFFKQARQYSHALRKVATASMDFNAWCERFLCPIIKHLVIEPKKGKKPGYCIVNDAFKP
jgi:Transposase DDE domain